MTISLEEHVARLLAAIEPLGVRKLVAGWNGENRPPEERYGPHPDGLGVTIETNCGALYALDAAITDARAAIAAVRERQGAVDLHKEFHPLEFQPAFSSGSDDPLAGEIAPDPAEAMRAKLKLATEFLEDVQDGLRNIGWGKELGELFAAIKDNGERSTSCD